VGKRAARSKPGWEASAWTAPACAIGDATDLLDVRIPANRAAFVNPVEALSAE